VVDKLVQTNVSSTLNQKLGLWGPYYSDEDKAVIVFIDNDQDLSFARTVNKGVGWTTTQIEVGTVLQVAVWYDKETPGDAGTLVHIAWMDSVAGDVYYITVDVADGSQGTKRTVDGTVDFTATDDFGARIGITKTVSGNLLVAFTTVFDRECYRSVNAGVDWTDRADVFEGVALIDWLLLFPAATADDDDACALFWDVSANEISLKVYDDSGDSWTEKSISGSMVEDGTHINMDASVRHSDSKILGSAHSDIDDGGDDLITFELTVDDPDAANCTVTAKTNVFTDQGESAQVAVFINQQNDDVYITYLKGGTWLATVDVVYHKSVNGMGSWGGEQSYSESAADDFRLVQAGRTVGNAGGIYQPSFYDDDQEDVYVNLNNDIEIAAVAALTVGEMMAARMMGPPMTPPVPAEVVAY
jgi:hypothetical protein